jgi:IS4 transposase
MAADTTESLPRYLAPLPRKIETVALRNAWVIVVVFAVLLYNIWRLTDFLLKAAVDGEMEYAPVLTASECVEIVVSALMPPD